MSIKMYAIFARETLQKMKKSQGKLAAQAGHAYLHAWWDAEDRFGRASPANAKKNEYIDTMYDYKNNDDARKIALVVDTVQDLEHLYELYRPYMGATLVVDCAYTIFDRDTTTAVGLGPVDDDWFHDADRPQLLKNLKTLQQEL